MSIIPLSSSPTTVYPSLCVYLSAVVAPFIATHWLPASLTHSVLHLCLQQTMTYVFAIMIPSFPLKYLPMPIIMPISRVTVLLHSVCRLGNLQQKRTQLCPAEAWSSAGLQLDLACGHQQHPSHPDSFGDPKYEAQSPRMLQWLTRECISNWGPLCQNHSTNHHCTKDTTLEATLGFSMLLQGTSAGGVVWERIRELCITGATPLELDPVNAQPSIDPAQKAPPEQTCKAASTLNNSL